MGLLRTLAGKPRTTWEEWGKGDCSNVCMVNNGRAHPSLVIIEMHAGGRSYWYPRCLSTCWLPLDHLLTYIRIPNREGLIVVLHLCNWLLSSTSQFPPAIHWEETGVCAELIGGQWLCSPGHIHKLRPGLLHITQCTRVLLWIVGSTPVYTSFTVQSTWPYYLNDFEGSQRVSLEWHLQVHNIVYEYSHWFFITSSAGGYCFCVETMLMTKM